MEFLYLLTASITITALAVYTQVRFLGPYLKKERELDGNRPPAIEPQNTHRPKGTARIGLSLIALGVVFGDIGTSPLYAFKECLHHGGNNPEAVYGIISLILWSLITLVSVKYVTFVLKADNEGEGGILALLNLAFPSHQKPRQSTTIMTTIGLLGAALLYGDGIITPAISVLSAVEGLNTISPQFQRLVIPLAAGILLALFAVQKFGTHRLGKVFGYTILLWCGTIAYLGTLQIIHNPDILAAINPNYGLQFLMNHGTTGAVVIGSVFLAVTGGEALYADMGHFGRIPIKRAWNFIVLPALALNYLGQGALVLEDPSAASNPFYLLANPTLVPLLVLLATAATIIAAQALISGAFSLTMQACQMGYLPRIRVEHTNHQESGQIFIPQLNRLLGVACILLVLIFQSSSALASAYGVAVTLTMLATTSLFFFVAKNHWKWNPAAAFALCGAFGLIEMCFFASNALKILHGGWLPLGLGAAIFYAMTTWKMGRTHIRAHMANTMPLGDFISSITLPEALGQKIHRVRGTAVFFSSTPNATPECLVNNIRYNQVLHQRTIVVSILSEKVPTVPISAKAEVKELQPDFYQVTMHFGFMEIPTVECICEAMEAKNLDVDLKTATFFLGRETLVKSEQGLSALRETVFVTMSRNAQNAAQFFNLPNDRTVEIGKQIRI